ncbi:DMT family transporter [Desulforhabdus amnigena]|uniref:Transporter n=1 Tax=Desulforhabdus amnigena TaxID=40218 RepID=A0A9W6FTV1_9BACT|nr:DMT family transporter [Desulforhabdus amnigena]NLJ29247.1 DMT family transporter [Deltaproteobacteria bacterium]GLI34266.1 transporter [Desulforhabdus amnigena]
MKKRTLRADILLILTATIWGFAFVAQRVGMDYVGPFTFNAVRFALGSLSLIPLLLFNHRQEIKYRKILPGRNRKMSLSAGCFAGLALYLGASLQQVGLIYTTAGKAGFITGLYVVIVPIMGLFWRQRPELGTWAGALLAAVGLYLLSVTGKFTISYGDLLVLAGAFFWASHVHLVGWFSARVGSIKLAFLQFAVCSFLSFITAFAVESISLQSILRGLLPILYGGFMSVGIAYTLQVVAQQEANPAHASIILSLESVFAAVGGWILLSETLPVRGLIGCGLMLSGMLLSQFNITADSLRTFMKAFPTRTTST